ncbi:MAG TPA: MASE1 domain-containing protein [Candidatus Saccharimonadales bacterium]|nr:MASE1 domain-containing protein [Candidatus Saccharimonadales bacterium]
MKDTTYKYILKLIILGALYFIAGKLGLKLAYVNTNVTAVWPPTGIALAAFLMFGYRMWPAIFIGAFFTNITTTGTTAPIALAIAVGNTLEGLTGAYLVNKFASGKNAFLKAQNIFLFLLLAVILSPTVSANIGVTSLILGGKAQLSNFFQIWFTWWMGDAIGALIVTPFFLFWNARHRLYSSKGHKLEAFLLFLILLILSIFIFGGIFPQFERAYPLEFLSIPIIVWVAFRFGRRETITAIVVLAGIAIWGTLNGYGPFIRASQNESLLILQSFMAVITITALTLAVAVAERRSTQDALQVSEQRFKALIEKSSEAVSLTDPNGLISYVSPSFTRVLGYKPEEVIGKSGFIFIHPEDVEYAKNTTSKIVGKPGESVVTEIRCVHKDGTFRSIEITSTNLLDNPSIKAVVSNFHDITDIVKTEDKIMQEKAEDEALLESIGDGIMATDPEGKITYVNKAFEEQLGWKQGELEGKQNFEKLIIEDESGKLISEKDHPLTQALNTRKLIKATQYLVRKNGEKFPAIITATPVVLNGKIIGAIKVIHDVTKEKEIDRAKTEFVSLASHQLRTPPSIVKWYTEMLLNNPDFERLTDKQKEYIRQISAAGQRMVVLVNTLLNVSRLELGTFKSKPEQIDVVKVARDVLSELAPAIGTKKLKILEDYSKDLPKILEDLGSVTIIFQNLFSNAVKYTPEKGTIKIKISKENGKISIMVTDSGYGIPQSQQPKMFTKLFRADNVLEKVPEGNGLGLYIVKALLDRMGGKISFKSIESKGTTFSVSLPLKEEQAQK